MSIIPLIIVVIFVLIVDLSGFGLDDNLTKLLYVEEADEPVTNTVSNEPKAVEENIGVDIDTAEEAERFLKEIYEEGDK